MRNVKQFNVRFQCLFISIIGAVRAVQQDPAFKAFTVDVAEMALVGREELGRKGAAGAAEWF